MARYYRRFRRYFRRYMRRYGYGRRRYRRRRFVNGSSKSTIRVKIPVSTVISFTAAPAGTVWPSPLTPFEDVTAVGNVTSALNSPLYQNYANLYDEVKCIGAKVVVSIGTPIGTSTIPNLTLVTAWDRRYGYEEPVPTFGELNVSGSSQRAVAVNNSVAKLVRSCYASDLLEKAQWHDCTLVTNPAIPLSHDEAWHAAGSNPNFFSPAMFIGVSHGGDTNQTIKLLLDINYYFSFRNPKYGGSSSGNKDIPVRAASLVSMDEEPRAGKVRLHGRSGQTPPSKQPLSIADRIARALDEYGEEAAAALRGIRESGDASSAASVFGSAMDRESGDI